MKRIKLYEEFLNEHKGPKILGSFQEAEETLSDKEGIVLSMTGDITQIEDSLKNIPHQEAYVLVTDKSGNPESWKSDVFILGVLPKEEVDHNGITIKEYFNKNQQ